MVRRMGNMPIVRRSGRLFLMKYPKIRPYFIYVAKQFGFVIHTKAIRPIPILQSQSLSDLSPRAIQIYCELKGKNCAKEKQ